MPTTNAEISSWVLSQVFFLLLVLMRTLGLTTLLPEPCREIPKRVRFYGVLAFSFFIFILVGQSPVPSPDSVLSGTLLLLSEYATGLFLSAILFIFFSAMTMAGEIIGRMAGFSLANSVDPTLEEGLPVLSRFLTFLGLVVFLCAGGLEELLVGYLDSFQSIEPGTLLSSGPSLESFLTLLHQSLLLAVRLSAPVILSALSILLTLGIVGRAVPQLNVMILGLNANALLILAALTMSLGMGLRLFEEKFMIMLSEFGSGLIPQ